VNSWKIILATIVIFGAGVTTGGLLVSHVDRSNRNNHRPPGFGEFRPLGGDREQGRGMGMEFPRPRQPDMLNTNFVRRLDDALKLTADQRSAIAKIIAEGQDQNHSIWTNNAEQMRKVMQDVHRRLHDALTPDQQKQFDELMRRPPRRPPNATNASPVMPPAHAPAASTNVPGA
jgi:Spy/CpxP family protein refolding chaperone